jgi:hypothetical protein
MTVFTKSHKRVLSSQNSVRFLTLSSPCISFSKIFKGVRNRLFTELTILLLDIMKNVCSLYAVKILNQDDLEDNGFIIANRHKI